MVPGRKVTVFAAGSCRQREALSIRDGAWRAVEFPALCSVFFQEGLGWVLYDTGYDPEIASATAPFLMRLYANLMSVQVERSVSDGLREMGVEPEEVKVVLLSHFHPDHIGGAKQFPRARFICSRVGYDEACRRAMRLGFDRKLLPSDFESRCEFVEEKQEVEHDGLSRFGSVYDVFGDRSVLAVLFDGHAPSQMACLLVGEKRSCFLLADAAWSRRAIYENRPPYWLTRLIQDDWAALVETLSRLHCFAGENSSVYLVPSHCEEALEESPFRLDEDE